jgi:ABC-type transport system substrate-binding protein
MFGARSIWSVSFQAAMLLALVTACAPTPPITTSPSVGETAPSSARTGQRKTLVMGLGAVLDAFSIAGSTQTGGGRLSFIEIHSQALFSADKSTGRPEPRLLAEQPTLDNGGLRILDDQRMVATYKLRKDVKWADGVPLTSRDLLFTYQML